MSSTDSSRVHELLLEINFVVSLSFLTSLFPLYKTINTSTVLQPVTAYWLYLPIPQQLAPAVGIERCYTDKPVQDQKTQVKD